MDKQALNKIAARLRSCAAGWSNISTDQARALAVMALEIERETGSFSPRQLPQISHVQPR